MNPARAAGGSAAAPARVERTLPPGTRLGRYEIITHLASGGMASVFLARALGAAGFHRLVAIKLLHPHVAADEQFTHMFLDEARLAARIRHPNVVPTLDLQDDQEGHYLVMEFVEGESMLGLLRQGHKIGKPVPPSVAVRVILDVLEGLHAAHELTDDSSQPLHLVHRDVSPHNILVGVDGVARIVDFGIARAAERLGTTRDGQVKGKLAYMAPEQTTSEPVDRRVDVFTTAIVLWECLTQRRLFRGQTDAEALRMLLEKPIPHIREIVPTYPEALDEICARALSREPSARFATAADMAEALEKAAGSVGIATPRQVAAYVREVAGDTIDALMRRARAFQEGRTPSVPPPPVRGDNPNSAVRGSTPMNIPVDIEEEAALRPRKSLAFAFAVVGFVAVGAAVALAATTHVASKRREGRAVAPISATQVAAAATTTTTTTAATATSAPSVLAPSVTASVAEAPHAPVFTGHSNRRTPVASASASASAAPPSVFAPPPQNSAFNPEAM